jgi:uncharacterized protein YbcI
LITIWSSRAISGRCCNSWQPPRTPAEQQLAKIPSEKGRDLLKQVRTHLIETAKPLLQAMVQEITGVEVISLHHDISTLTGEAFVVLTLAEPPSYRQAKKT